jgi:hypothetical protein
MNKATNYDQRHHDESETKFGIKAYASPNVPGFGAVLKGRFSDFLVHEGMSLRLFSFSLLYYYHIYYRKHGLEM